MHEIVFVDGARSAFGKLGGGLRKLSATEIAAHVVKGLTDKTDILNRGTVDTLLMGTALGDSRAAAPARYTALLAGLPIETSAIYVEMQCGSAITAINHAAWRMLAGMSEIAIVGGAESYSTLAAKYSTSQAPYRAIGPTPIPISLTPNQAHDTNMLQNNDIMAKTWSISREACDEFSIRSQQLLQKAYATGLIGDEIIPYVIPSTKKSPQIVIDKDEHPRPSATLESIASMRPVYEGGVTTAANSSGRNDGAAFVLMMTAEKAKELGYTPFARWVTGAHMGCEEHLMGVGAAYSTLKALKQAKLRLQDIDVYECNEAFAAQNLLCIKEMQTQTGEQIEMANWNPNGGAIAIGHPNAASGARITWFAMKELERKAGKFGAITSCCGGGQGTTAIIENLRR